MSYCQYVSHWQDGETRDIQQEMMLLTMNIVAKTIFDTDVGAEATELGASSGPCSSA